MAAKMAAKIGAHRVQPDLDGDPDSERDKTGHMIDPNRTTVKTKLKRKICKFDMVCTNYLCMRYSVSTKSV